MKENGIVISTTTIWDTYSEEIHAEDAITTECYGSTVEKKKCIRDLAPQQQSLHPKVMIVDDHTS
jgi:hypothetical protein